MFIIQETFLSFCHFFSLKDMDVGMATNDITVGMFDEKFHQVSSMNPMLPQSFSTVTT